MMANNFVQEGLIVNHYCDFGHAKKSLRNAFSVVRRELNYILKNEQSFYPYGVVEKMINFAKFVVNTIEDPNVRGNLLINAPNHFIGDHSRPLKDNK